MTSIETIIKSAEVQFEKIKSLDPDDAYVWKELLTALKNKNSETIKFLLEDERSNYNSKIYYDMLKLLSENDVKIDASYAEERLDVRMIEFILKKRKPNYVKRDEGVEKFSNLNDYLIHKANIPKAVSFLLKHGCDVEYL